MKYLGIDGCKGGWLVAALDDDGGKAFFTLREIAELSSYLAAAEVVLLDIPIGLRGRHPEGRLCDSMAREVLKPIRSSSVFPAPSRCALAAEAYEEASQRNYACTGKKLTRQTFAILPKIREVDDFLRRTEAHGKVREMHPEVCFWALNNARSMNHRKKSVEGYEERVLLLSRFLPGAGEFVEGALKEHGRAGAGRDDIVDALVGAVTARLGDLRCLPEAPETDDEGLPMEIVYAAPSAVPYPLPAPSESSGGQMLIKHYLLELSTGEGIALHDTTPQIRSYLAGSGIRNGFVTVTSRHTTTAIIINENEARLLDDVKAFLARLIPPGDRYLHNDIHLRDCPPDEPENAHSHLAAMLLGSSEVIPVSGGKLMLGQYQSVMLCELDGPRRRSVSVQVFGE